MLGLKKEVNERMEKEERKGESRGVRRRDDVKRKKRKEMDSSRGDESGE